MSYRPMPLPIVEDTLRLLTNLAEEPREPRDAMRAAAEIGRRHNSEIELVWEREPYDGRIHYDALLRDGTNTLSIAVCPDTATPWPIRGLQRWADSDLLRVDGRVVTIQSAVDMLDIVWSEDRLLTRLVDAAILLREKEERGISEPDDLALQEALDDFRRERGLWTSDETEGWLAEHGLDLERLESALADRIVRDQIRDAVIPEGPADVRARDLDVVVAATVDLADQAEAERLAAQVRAGEPLLRAAQALMLGGSKLEVSLAAPIARHTLAPSLAEILFAASPGEIVGPVQIPGRLRLFEILAIRPADADAPGAADALREIAFARWMTEQRRRAKIEWSWGRAEIEDKPLLPPQAP